MAKILCVLTGASYWTLKDGHRHPTGYWAEEFVAPYSVFTDAGHEVTVATPHGVVPVTDTMSLEPRMAGGEENALREEAVIESADELRSHLPRGGAPRGLRGGLLPRRSRPDGGPLG